MPSMPPEIYRRLFPGMQDVQQQQRAIKMLRGQRVL